ncbi:MAG: hypothetical protein WDW38_006660 [Sanguina aurantia]
MSRPVAGHASKKRTREDLSDSERVQAAVEDGDVTLVDEQPVADSKAPDNTVASVVTMKLGSFCLNPDLHKKINSVVLDINRLTGEAYAFGNFHALRLLDLAPDGGLLVEKDWGNYYYRCLLAVSVNKSRASTLGPEWVASRSAFDALRPHGSQKVDISNYNQVVASLRITMATMAKNHLWMNLEGRLARYVRNKYPTLKGMGKRIVQAVVKLPKANLDDLFAPPVVRAAASSCGAGGARGRKTPTPPASGGTPASTPKTRATSEHYLRLIEEAKALCMVLRKVMPLKDGKQFSTNAYLTLPLYRLMLADTEALRQPHTEVDDPSSRRILHGLRLFELLPSKAGYTTSYVTFSTMALMHMLRTLKMEKLVGDGRSMDKRAFWLKYFDLKCVETGHGRCFGGSINTDGSGVSILMERPSALIAACTEPCCAEMRTVLRERDICRAVGVDPGFTDVVTVAAADGSKPSGGHATEKDRVLARYKPYLVRYLAILQTVLQHRFDRGYRNMRFLRGVHKRRAVNEICALIAPPDKVTLVGFGDWGGGSGSPISRRTCGPLQEIKLQLSKQPNVYMKVLDEHRTSQTCNGCLQQLSNMRAMSTVNTGNGSLLTAGNRMWALGPIGALSLFDGGLRHAREREAKATFEEAAGQYRVTVLGAFQQVEDNLSLLTNLSREAHDEDDAAAAAQDAATIATNRYSEGIVNYLGGELIGARLCSKTRMRKRHSCKVSNS